MLRIGYCWNVLLYYCLCSGAAAQTFNIRVDPQGSVGNSGTGWSIEPTTDGRFIAIAAVNYLDSTTQLFYSSVVTAILIDAQGTVLSVERVIDSLHATYPGWSNSTGRRIDGGFCVGGNTFRTDTLGNWISRAALFQFSSDGSHEATVAVSPDDQSWIGRQAKQTPDGGFVICGETSAVGNALEAFVIKTDAVGNEEWTNTYGGEWNDYMVAIDNAEDGDYFSGGQARISASNRQFWVQRLSNSGDVIWDRKWGGPFPESNANVTVATNGDVLVAGSWSYGNNALGRRYLARLDPSDGSFIWQREYGSQTIDVALQVVKEVFPSMDLISAGPMAQGLEYFGTLFRTTSAGDSLWMRYYQYYDDVVSNGKAFFRDVEPTPDGGFIACGSALPVTHADTLQYTQDVWVVKTDSMGCIEPGCHVITGVETQITNLKNVLRVWPNPVAAGSAMQVCVELPEGFAVQGQLRLTITDALGRLVQEQNIPSTSGTIPLSLGEGLGVRGIYHLHVSDAQRWISGVSFVVE
ncbi:MAG TPA: T9SS type A sorting domain-containing protein [Flavobacteriales bacterium]|nr:T9SS type A sorting domain-containing protein [Flavobacteriales bacterium]